MVYFDKYGFLIDHISKISKPAAPYIPAGWAADFLSLYLLDLEIDWLLLGLLLLTPFVLYFLGEGAMRMWFFPGYSKSQESFGGHNKFGNRRKYKPGTWQWIFNKEAKIFARDSAEWSQLFMIAALVVIRYEVRGQVLALLGVIIGYWALLKFGHAPGFEPGDLTMEGNVVSYFDRQFLPGHLHKDIHDPEGLLSTIGAVGTGLVALLLAGG